MYCSKECQKSSWKLTHKYTCAPIKIPPEEEESVKYYGKIINGWQNLWKWRLDDFALLALDLTNNPGKNVTHCMWLEFLYTGKKDDLDKFEIYHGCVRTAEEVLAESPRLHIMRDPPPLIGKRVRYVTVFHFDEEGKERQSFLRARSRELPDSLEPWKKLPAGWDGVYKVLQALFGKFDDDSGSDGARKEIAMIVPVDERADR